MSATLDFRNTNALWGSVLVETLARCGVREAVVSPGSRSTPLTIALARHPQIEAVPVLDERSAAFFALGLAKQHRRPVVLLCTSGTAGANYFPAVIEAQESNVPLLVITADRPPEMRDCASGQTIDQQRLFGGHANFYHELAVPEPRLDRLAYLRQTIAHAVMRTQSPAAGPVHLNAPFRDPLPPIEDASVRALAGQIGDDFFAHLDRPAPVGAATMAWAAPMTGRGVIVAGPAHVADPAIYAQKVSALATMLCWPVLADALSPVRSQLAAADIVTCYDAILREPQVAKRLRPEAVLCLGGWPTSKVLRGWLETSGAEVLLVATSAANRDALHGRARQIIADVESLAVTGRRADDAGYRAAWQQAEVRARSQFDVVLEKEKALFEPKACWLLAQHLPKNTPVFVASSMPVRDVEYFWPATKRQQAVYFNRGANGIDGTLSTALGIAHGNRPAVLLTGDLALLHDANGFLLRPKLRGSLTIVLINNAGGGIFEHLPVAQFDPPFEEFFATPQAVDFAKLCAAHDVEHVLIRGWPEFSKLIATLPEQGIRVLELRTDRKHDAARRKQLLADAAEPVRG
ncbi:2-succinyl-5-enolpyruvyl-6-hydroxy-3-cyclohexene-1-carboxylic-acid synthase [Opitutus terrae]|uniref:2-succinyl-5-enolpyruvyl-6-hydroxy-3-cyclohexene-1-carboxylate synthase n=1 Tax=Opitutus terrae (strain DSM 11246 / JCM 15787 / PB90-1) TaxID=452637 RepID=B1ZXC9_OPITP|nr:2-succinyl-5-enolpyruvyl-6-hydroxy-3-cyclohexene-1-carboxylic-acid synthase [Opitutus terrae]ACB76924.1 2-succinyl-6-hydroxy-2,4-cyclohexadiene-1-carboxylic acid synthase/2-oxoglutarate decarboxylase [Opitutus terrae PB90-1]